jgi:hypothetical protein
LKENITTIITPDFTSREFKSPLLKGLMKLTPLKTITLQYNKQLIPILFSLISILIGSVFSGLNQVFPFLLFFNESIFSNSALDLISQSLFSLFFFINFLIYFIIIEGVCRLFYNKKENSLTFFEGFGIIFFPNDIYLIIHYLLKVSDSLNFPTIGIIDNILMILFQLWSLWLLSFSLTVNKLLKFESSLIITLLTHYGGFSLFLLLSI